MHLCLNSVIRSLDLFFCMFVSEQMNSSRSALGIIEQEQITVHIMTSAACDKGLHVCVCVWTTGLIVWECVFASIHSIQPAFVCVCMCVWCCREQGRTTGRRLHCYTSNELPGASAFLTKSSLWSLLYLIPVGQVPSSLLPISVAAI